MHSELRSALIHPRGHLDTLQGRGRLFPLSHKVRPLRKGPGCRPIASQGTLGQLAFCLPEDGSAAPGMGSHTWHHSGAIRRAGPSLTLYACGTQKQASASALILPVGAGQPHTALSPGRSRGLQALRRHQRACPTPILPSPALSLKRNGRRRYQKLLPAWPQFPL